MPSKLSLTGWLTFSVLLSCALDAAAQSPVAPPGSAWENLGVEFGGRHGQVEAGGPFVGVEFHHSRPLPARISFYYPVANSIDLSSDYWERDHSQPFSVRLAVEGELVDLGTDPFPYTWTPYRVDFENELSIGTTRVSYRFSKDFPLLVWSFKFINSKAHPVNIEAETILSTSLRTSHTYAVRDRALVRYVREGKDFVATFDEADTGKADIFVLNAGEMPVVHGSEKGEDPEARFTYRKTLAAGETFEIIHLIGSTSRTDSDSIRAQALERWKESVEAYEREVEQAVFRDHLLLPDSGLMRSARLARALLQANQHFLNGQIVPMPCPAEYNFFFTHDLLLTDLAAVLFDTERVRRDLAYVRSLTGSDSVLAHAYYWKDGDYVTEPAGSDNWNHLWFVILTASYLKHSGDRDLVTGLLPILEKSMQLMLRNERDGLMWAIRPDWWDIGNVYGPRAYLTILTIRALEAYHYIQTRLGRNPPLKREALSIASRLRLGLVERLWDEDVGYLLNRLDSSTVDRHFYSGSLLAPAFGYLDTRWANRLLDTAERELLDPSLGIRNAMPADFHTLIDRYRFNGMEAGGPFLYLNGGIWPQGSAWYALALLRNHRTDRARQILQRYLSLDGILESPNGQPAFFEYRNGDPQSAHYGQIDKPTFLWAGGWYLYVLYGLAGVRENAWNISFDPHLPQDFNQLAYDLQVEGRRTRVTWNGSMPYFRQIRVDGIPSASAIITAPFNQIELERGLPLTPYLASATGTIGAVTYDAETKTLRLDLSGTPGQEISLVFVSPSKVSDVTSTHVSIKSLEEKEDEYTIITGSLTVVLETTPSHVDVIFH